MKQITMDYETYQEELQQAFGRGWKQALKDVEEKGKEMGFENTSTVIVEAVKEDS